MQTWIDDPRAWERQIHPDDRERVLATTAAAQNGEIQYRCEYRLLAMDGRVVWVLDGAEVVRDAGGRPVAVQGVALDITERKQKMPRLDGIELWNAVKRDDPALAARFVFFTGDTLSPATAEFLERSGAPSLRKPFTSGDIRLALARVHDGAPRAEVAPQA